MCHTCHMGGVMGFCPHLQLILLPHFIIPVHKYQPKIYIATVSEYLARLLTVLLNHALKKIRMSTFLRSHIS
jgi:hypothetical protein